MSLSLTARTREDLVALGCRAWDDSGLMLIPLALLERVEPGTVLTSIAGVERVVGRDEIDTDTRWGLLAVGVFHSGAKGLKYLRTELGR